MGHEGAEVPRRQARSSAQQKLILNFCQALGLDKLQFSTTQASILGPSWEYPRWTKVSEVAPGDLCYRNAQLSTAGIEENNSLLRHHTLLQTSLSSAQARMSDGQAQIPSYGSHSTINMNRYLVLRATSWASGAPSTLSTSATV